MKKVFYLILVILVSCSKDGKKEEAVPNMNKVPESQRQQYADYLSKKQKEQYLENQKDSLIQAFKVIPSKSVGKSYYNGLTSKSVIEKFMLSGEFKKYIQIKVFGETGSTLRNIYFKKPEDPNDVRYEKGTVIVCENLNRKTGENINYEVMEKTEKGWNFYVFDHGMSLTSDGKFYDFPKDCINCHYENKNIDPFFKFNQYLNTQHPITKNKIEYNGFIQFENQKNLQKNPKSDGVFGPYKKLVAGIKN